MEIEVPEKLPDPFSLPTVFRKPLPALPACENPSSEMVRAKKKHANIDRFIFVSRCLKVLGSKDLMDVYNAE